MDIRLKLTKAANLSHYGKKAGDIIALSLEDVYLPICVSSEIYENNGRTPEEAKKAQAVASRTYVAALALAGVTIDDTSTYQSFNWKDPATIPNCMAAVKATEGQVLFCGGKMITAWYSNANGGETKRSDQAWSAATPWTVNKPDPWDTAGRKKWGEAKASHGVGMSQIGAAYAASVGVSYADILAFYYPNTVIAPEYGQLDEEETEMIRAYDLCAYGRSTVGGGYCYGASGETCSLALRQELAKWNPSQKTNLLGICAKWDGMPVWDCSGLFRGAWRALAKYKSGGATTIFKTWCNKTGVIADAPDTPGIAVFRAGSTGSTMEHMGLYVGGGMVVDARGSASGVLYGAKSGYPWTHYGMFADVDYSDGGMAPPVITVLYEGMIKTQTGGGVSLWRDNTKASRITTIAEGATVQVLSTPDPKGFVRTQYDSLIGVADAQYIAPAGEADEALYEGAIKTKTGGGVSLWSDNTKTAKVASVPEGATVRVLSAPDAKGFAKAQYGALKGVVDTQYVVPDKA